MLEVEEITHPDQITYFDKGRWFNFLSSFLDSTRSQVEISEIENEIMYGNGYIPSQDNIFLFKATFSRRYGHFHLINVEFIRNSKDGRIIRKTLYDTLQPTIIKDICGMSEVFKSRDIEKYQYCDINDKKAIFRYKKYWNFLQRFEQYLEKAALKKMFKIFSDGRNTMFFSQSLNI